MNYIQRVAEMLGVEIGEEFKIRQIDDGKLYSTKFRFTEKDFQYYSEDSGWVPSFAYAEVIRNNAKIIRYPYKPKDGDKYWTVVWKRKQCHADLDTVECIYWDDIGDHFREALGLVYRTREEAEADKYKAFERVVKKTWEEW